MKKIFFIFYFLFFTLYLSQAQNNWLWGKDGVGNSGETWSAGVDGQGNCYFIGQFLWPIKFGTYDLSNNGNATNVYNTFVVKTDNVGNIIWARQTVNKANNKINAATDAPWSMAVDYKGNSYVTSDFPDTIYIGRDTLRNTKISYGQEAIFVAKYDLDGNVKWAKQSTTPNDSGDVITNSIATDLYGNVYVAGAFMDTIYLGPQKVVGFNANTILPFLVKYDSNGNVKWTRQATGNVGIYGNTQAVTTDRKGNIYTAGMFTDTLHFGLTKVKSSPYSETNIFLVKYDSAGNALWAKQSTLPGSLSAGAPSSLATDLDGNVYVAGNFLDTIIFNQDTLIGSQYYPRNQRNFFLVKYDSAGNLLWAKQSNVLDSDSWNVENISSDNHGHIYMSILGGATQSYCKVAFGRDTFDIYDTAKYDGVSVIMKLDSNGNALCSSTILGAGFKNCIASDTSGNYVYFGGDLTTPWIFGEDTINPFSIPLNAEQDSLIMYEHVGEWNIFPFIARWEECDNNLAGVNTIKPSNEFNAKVYPNPNNGIFTLSLSNVNTACSIEIYNVLGETIYQSKLSSNNTKIGLGVRSSGVYLYRVNYENGNLIGQGKIIIQK